MEIAELVMNPVRQRIFQYLLVNKTGTVKEIRKALPELKTHIDLTPVQKSLTEMQRSLAEMNKLLERVGNLSERYSSKWIDWLPDFSLLVALKWIALLLVIGAAALAGWYGAAAIRGLFL